jgi:hypothetical protein
MTMCDGPEFFSESFPRSKVERICSECRRKIAKGDQYWRYSGKWEGEFETHLTCGVCRWVVWSLHKIHDDFCFYAYKLADDVKETFEMTGCEVAEMAVNIMNSRPTTSQEWAIAFSPKYGDDWETQL